MAIKSLRILVELLFATSPPFRLWEGAGPFLDANGDLWAGTTLTEGLDLIERAMNGQSTSLVLTLSGTDRKVAELATEDRRKGNVIGARVRIMIQPCDAFDQPVGEPRVKFTGLISDMMVKSDVGDDGVRSAVVIEVTNRMVLRRMRSGQVLSDVNQKARSAAMNPGAPADRIADRVSGYADKARVWPRFS